MQQKIENVAKQQNKKEKKQENKSRSMQQKNIQINNVIQIIKHKRKYLTLFLMLLQVIITTVILVLLITLGYVGFIGWNGYQGTNKIHVETIQHCDDEYMRRQSEFIVIKIKAAFIILCVQFSVVFICMVGVFQLLIKIVIHQKLDKGHNLSNMKPLFIVVNVLLSISIMKNVILFGTYLGFYIKGNTNKLSQQCRLNIINSEIITIMVLFAVKLGLLLIVWGQIICQTVNYHSRDSQQKPQKPQRIDLKVSNPKFPQIQSFHSFEEYNIQQKKRKNLVMNTYPTDQQYNFGPLKTEDFLLELKNNQNTENHLKLFMIKNKTTQVEKQQFEDNCTNRRLIIDQPKMNKQCIQMENDHLSVQQKQMKGILSLNSVNKGLNDRNKFINSDKQQIGEIKSIIDKMNQVFQHSQ